MYLHTLIYKGIINEKTIIANFIFDLAIFMCKC